MKLNQQRQCILCHEPFIPKWGEKQRKIQKLCSKECQSEYASLTTNTCEVNQCLECKKEFLTGFRRKKFCGRTCSANYRLVARGLIKKPKITYPEISYCIVCDIRLEPYSKRKCCSKSCVAKSSHAKRVLKDNGPKHRYKLACRFRFNAHKTPKVLGFDLLKKHSLGSVGKTDELHRDHMLSITDGFVQGIDPSIISHPANCQIMFRNQNMEKYSKSSISLEELVHRIKNW